MGMAFAQLGKLKEYLLIANEKDDGTFDEYVIINPKNN